MRNVMRRHGTELRVGEKACAHRYCQKVGKALAPDSIYRTWYKRNFHLLLNLNKWKINTDRTVTNGTVTQNPEVP